MPMSYRETQHAHRQDQAFHQWKTSNRFHTDLLGIREKHVGLATEHLLALFVGDNEVRIYGWGKLA
jgi:hypothetical protein